MSLKVDGFKELFEVVTEYQTDNLTHPFQRIHRTDLQVITCTGEFEGVEV